MLKNIYIFTVEIGIKLGYREFRKSRASWVVKQFIHAKLQSVEGIYKRINLVIDKLLPRLYSHDRMRCSDIKSVLEMFCS